MSGAPDSMSRLLGPSGSSDEIHGHEADCLGSTHEWDLIEPRHEYKYLRPPGWDNAVLSREMVIFKENAPEYLSFRS